MSHKVGINVHGVSFSLDSPSDRAAAQEALAATGQVVAAVTDSDGNPLGYFGRNGQFGARGLSELGEALIVAIAKGSEVRP
jgi:hypothetical protein